jgi:hypothetical protein
VKNPLVEIAIAAGRCAKRTEEGIMLKATIKVTDNTKTAFVNLAKEILAKLTVDAYKCFLKHCREINFTIASDNGHFSVGAGKHCPEEHSPNSSAYCQRNSPLHTYLWVRRPRDKDFDFILSRKSTDDDIERFVSESPNPAKELSLLSHEYGHYTEQFTNRRGIGFDKWTIELCRAEYRREITAWNVGKALLEQLGFKDWSVFEDTKKTALKTYADGFRNCFPEFQPED